MALYPNPYYKAVKDKKFPVEEKSSTKSKRLVRRIKKMKKSLSTEKDHLRIYDLNKRLAEAKRQLLAMNAPSSEFYDFISQKRNNNTRKVNSAIPSFTKKYEIPAHWTMEFIASMSFLQSHEWKSLRYEVLRHYDNLNAKKCMLCNIASSTLNVDHIKPRRFYPTLALDGSNLQILCAICNAGKANKYGDHRPKIVL